jgi:hypothetical protein
MISELNNNLVVRFTDYNTHQPFLSFLGTHDCEKTIQILIDYCKNNNLPTELRFMPEISISGTSPTKFIIEESARDFDYIFSTKKLALLNGKEFQRKRKDANRFWRENPSAHLDCIKLTDHEVKKQILDTIKTWEHYKIDVKKKYEIDHELAATKRLFESDCLDSLLGMGLYSDNVMLGYAIGEKLPNNYAICHFLRTTLSNLGVSEALMQGYAKYLDSLQITYLNFESDLDHDEIRRFKVSWRPDKYLKRYNVQYIQT